MTFNLFLSEEKGKSVSGCRLALVTKSTVQRWPGDPVMPIIQPLQMLRPGNTYPLVLLLRSSVPQMPTLTHLIPKVTR